MKKHIISVIVPIYNISQYIDMSIKSIMNQTYLDLEIILVDDGSTDNSGEICDQYALLDKRIKVIHKENGGLVVARKVGIENATGEYIAFVDGDDWIEPEMYAELLELCIKSNADFVESGYISTRNDSNIKHICKEKTIYLNDIEREKIIREWMNCTDTASIRSTIWSKLYRAELIRDTYTRVDDLRSYGEDFINYLYLISKSKKVVVSSEMYYHYNYRQHSLSHDTTIGRLKNSCGLFCRCCEIIGELYPNINESVVNTWFAQHTVEDFCKLNFDKEVPMPLYKIDNIDDLRNKKIVIYGAGNVGKDIYIQLCKYSDIQIVDWIDKNNDKYNYHYCPVNNVSVLPLLEYDIILIAVLRENVAKSIKNDILSMGCDVRKILWKKVSIISEQYTLESVGYDIVKIMGGLGNQMFQYALYRSLQERGYKAKVDIQSFIGYKRPFELKNVFPNVKIEIDEQHKYDSYKYVNNTHELYQEKENGVFDNNVLRLEDCSIFGYWQTEKYFNNIDSIIRKEFTFSIHEQTLARLADNLKNDSTSVSVHIRRGDYLETPDLYCNICTLQYYKKAISYICNEIDNPHFYVFSDDIEWVKEKLKIAGAFYVIPQMFEEYHNWYDMYLMSCCKHNIIANSSFSWWGAWLNPNKKKMVICPNRWLNGEDTRDIWCDSWTKITT